MVNVIKYQGHQQEFDRVKMQKNYEHIAEDLLAKCPFEDFKQQLQNYIVEGISTTDVIKLMIKAAINLITIENTDRQIIAGRIAMMDIYKQAARNRKISIHDIYTPETYLSFFEEYVANGLYDPSFFTHYSREDILKAGAHLAKTRDMEYGYSTISMFKKRYLLNPNKIIKELPQEMYMSAALFLAIPEVKEKRVEIAIEMYEYISSQKISLPTPTLMNARTRFHQLSSCFKLNVDDDLRSIYHNIENMAQISKFGGGIGVYLGNIRCKGSDIRGVKWVSGGVMPWVKVINDTAIAVNQLWARTGAISVTLDIWHKDILDYLDMQTETGDIRRKSFDLFPSVSVPDVFMQRVRDNQDWTLFDPKELERVLGEKLQDFTGEEFTRKYQELEINANVTIRQTINAKELFKKFMKSVVETGMPYTFFRDTVNKYNPNRHAGNIYSTQLCTEIAQNTSTAKFIEETEEDGTINIKYKAGDLVVCNLASINVAKVNTQEDIDAVLPIAMRILDNVITLNFYPVKEAELTAKRYRSVGLWFLGLAEYLATHKMVYDSPFARAHVDELFEKYAYTTLKSSCQLAEERGMYELFPGSDRSKGILFGRPSERYADHTSLKTKRTELIANIKKHGLRFAYHLAPAPNTSTSIVVWTTAWVLPTYKKYFVDNNGIEPTVNVAPGLNAENMRFYKEYVNMKMPEVIKMISTIQKWIDQAISFEWMINPAEVSPTELYACYMQARQEEIKTIYYVRSMSLDPKECVSCSG